MKYSTIDKAFKSIVQIPGWQQRLLDDSRNFTNHIDNVQSAYSNVPLVYRAVKMRCDAISSVPVKIYKDEKEVDPPFKIDFPSLLWLIEADLLGAGKAVILKLRNRVRVLDLQRLNPFTVTVQYSAQGTTFIQQGQQWGADDVIYIKEFSYSDDITSGASTIEACLNDAALMNYQTRFASKFFESGAMPIVLVSAEGIQDDEKERIEKFFTRLASGVSNAWRALATRTKLTPQVVSQNLNDMTMPELYSQATKNIASAFGIPVNLFQGDDNYASADSHRMQFWQDVVRPRGRIIESAFNKQFFDALGLRMELAFDELDIFQEDENKRAASFKIYVDAGVNPLAAAEMLGIEYPENIPFLAEREMPVVPDMNIDKNNDEQDNPFTDELAKWQRKALKRVKDGKSADCNFESEHIPSVLADEIHAALKLCGTTEEVDAVFEGKEEPTGFNDLLMELKRASDLLESEPAVHTAKGASYKAPEVVVNIPEQPAPVVNVPAPVVNISVPEQPAPVVNVSVSDLPAPVVNVPAPVVNVNVPEQKPPVVNVNPLDDKKNKLVVNRNSRGEITSVERK